MARSQTLTDEKTRVGGRAGAAGEDCSDDSDLTDEALDEEDAALAAKYYNAERGEYGGPTGEEPTRFGDWEKNGRCSDF